MLQPAISQVVTSKLASAQSAASRGAALWVATVLVDEPALDREFSYLVPAELAESLSQQPGDVELQVGTIVNVRLQQRRLRGWITRLQTLAEHEAASYQLEPLMSVSGIGPPPNVVELTSWAAQRWAGTRVHFLRAASPDRVVRRAPVLSEPHRSADEASFSQGGFLQGGFLQDELGGSPVAGAEPDRPNHRYLGNSLDNVLSNDFAVNPPEVIQVGTGDDWVELLLQARRAAQSSKFGQQAQVLALTPSLRSAHRLAGALRTQQIPVAVMPQEWGQALTAQVAIGARGAAWAPVQRLGAAVVFDEHDQSYESESAPTWNARTVVLQRALVDDAKCFLVSPAPSPDALLFGRATAAPQSQVQPNWPQIEVVDRRNDDPMSGEWCSDRLARIITDSVRSAASQSEHQSTDQSNNTVCVLNRKGRARLAICRECGELARSETTGVALKIVRPATVTPNDGPAEAVVGDQLVDPTTGESRPLVCESCGGFKFKRSRLGVKGVAAELEALARQPVTQITRETPQLTDNFDDRDRASEVHVDQSRPPGLFIGTEAVLHRLPSAKVVAFLDFDQELSAARYRAQEEAMALLVLAARLVGLSGRVVVQTRQPDHPVLDAVTSAANNSAASTPSGNPQLKNDLATTRSNPLLRWSKDLLKTRHLLRQPPCGSWALVSGAQAEEFVSRLRDWSRERGRSSGELEITSTSPSPARTVWRVRATHPQLLHEALSQVERPRGRLRVAVDPLRA